MASFTSSKFLIIGAALLGLASSSALPAGNLFSRQSTTPDGTCGASVGYRCPTDSYKCCSQWGWCGDTDEHCGAGCQAGYGSCTGTGGGGTTTTPPTTTPTTPPSTGGRSRPGSVPYGTVLSSCTVPGVVALTFDDGPYIYTSELLGILANNGVKATFFINGQNWGDPITTPGNQALLASVYNAGHQIGSHTWSHAYLSSLSEADATSQMTQVENALITAIGRYPTYMRPPYFDCGGVCPTVMNNLGYHIINADVDPLDYANTANIQPSRDAYANAINGGSSSSSFLVLNHDVHQTTVEQLVQFEIDTAKAKGYRLVTVGECMGDPAENWYRTA